MKGDVIRYDSFSDVVLNENSKQIVPHCQDSHDFRLQFMHVAYNSDATVGNRLLKLEMFDQDNNSVYHCHPDTFQDNNKLYHYYVVPGSVRPSLSTVDDVGVDGTIVFTFPLDFVVPKGYSLYIGDEADISAADDFEIRGQVAVLR